MNTNEFTVSKAKSGTKEVFDVYGPSGTHLGWTFDNRADAVRFAARRARRSNAKRLRRLHERGERHRSGLCPVCRSERKGRVAS